MERGSISLFKKRILGDEVAVLCCRNWKLWSFLTRWEGYDGGDVLSSLLKRMDGCFFRMVDFEDFLLCRGEWGKGDWGIRMGDLSGIV